MFRRVYIALLLFFFLLELKGGGRWFGYSER
nr:MAG TPA: hypothetical protein [Caudoviricetes sp.]